MTSQLGGDRDLRVPLWQPVLFAALAGGMGWGIRGQYGHETGAMIAGLLVSLTLVLLLCPPAPPLSVARAVAWGTVAMGFGGSMTYGQTVGLTHDGPLIGHWGALGWGMLGLSIKGAIWIGFAGAFFGMGLGGLRYRPRELLGLMLALLGAYLLGTRILNYPFEPGERALPWIYFSDHWRWEPEGDLSPRREEWGGLLFALASLTVYTGVWRKDMLARRLALWGMLGGAVGFPLGQSLQAFHAWNRELFTEGLLAQLDRHVNWWNMMETTYGAVMGGMLGLGLWRNRSRIRPAPTESADRLTPAVEWGLLALHLPLLVAVEFAEFRSVDVLYDLGLIMGMVPIIAIAGGRWWPYLLIFPVTLLPIAGKTLRQLAYREDSIGLVPGWFLYFIAPMLLATGAAFWFGRRATTDPDQRSFVRVALLLCTWLYFLLNFAFFHFPWPWTDWTGRTPNGIIFALCALGLTALVFTRRSFPERTTGDSR